MVLPLIYFIYRVFITIGAIYSFFLFILFKFGRLIEKVDLKFEIKIYLNMMKFMIF